MLRITQPSPLLDEPLHIFVERLAPNQRVTLAAFASLRSDSFISFGHYTANAAGQIDCDTAACQGGTFDGVDGMGLFWSLRPVAGQRKGTRFIVRDVTKPLDLRVRLYASFLDEATIFLAAAPLVQLPIERVSLHPTVRRTSVSSGRLRGTLFEPGCDGACPGIIDLTGTGGGLWEMRAALLAAKGFVVFALAYFNHADLPKSVANVHLEYFEEAVEWLRKRDGVQSESVGVIGRSLGGDIAILMAIHIPRVKAVVAINAYHMLDANSNPLQYRGKRLPNISGEVLPSDSVDDVLHYAKARRRWQRAAAEGLVFAVERSSADTRFLLVASEDDQLNPSVESATVLQRRLGSRGRLLRLSGAGHLVDPPYMPHCAASFHSVMGSMFAWGGEPRQHKDSQIQYWKEAVEFLKSVLHDDGQTEHSVHPIESAVRSKY